MEKIVTNLFKIKQITKCAPKKWFCNIHIAICSTKNNNSPQGRSLDKDYLGIAPDFKLSSNAQLPNPRQTDSIGKGDR